MVLDADACYRALLTRDARFDGRFFTCVRTTGIYCRPICPARTPKPENVVFLPSAAAAQAAGFRPCLRCRPEASPEIGAWHGTASTVSRAIALIASGALDEGGVEALAARLGMGERQLRRLFRQHLGASPKAVAQARRVHLAKQLVTETALPMAEVALAAGFGSLRRFNDIFRALYGRPPGTLRRGAAQPAPSAVTLTLPFRPPYDWDAMLGFLAARAIADVERVEDGCYARSIALDGAQGSIAVRRAGRADALVATIRFPRIASLPRIVERIRRVFDLGADPAAIGAHLARDPRLAPLLAARPGLRVPGAWDGFELAVRAILGQQITVAAARALAGKLASCCGDPMIATEDGIARLFPRPEQVATVPELSRVLGMPRTRGASITGLAEAALADPSLFEPGPALEQAIPRLRALPGIGEWTAQYIAMRALREPDAFPAADIGLLRAMATDAGRPTPAQLLAHAEAWRPWRAYAVLHLWASEAPATEKRDGTHARPHPVPDRHDPARL